MAKVTVSAELLPDGKYTIDSHSEGPALLHLMVISEVVANLAQCLRTAGIREEKILPPIMAAIADGVARKPDERLNAIIIGQKYWGGVSNANYSYAF